MNGNGGSLELMVIIIGALITWTGSVISLVIWLTSKFRYLEQTIYREMDKHRREDDKQFDDHGRKIQRLELRAFGFSGPVAVEPRVFPEET